MKQRNGGIYRFIRKMMMIVSLIMAVLLGVRGVKEAGRHVDLKKAKAWVKEGADMGISYIWQHQYPAAAWDENSKSSIQTVNQEQTVGTLLCNIVLFQSPMYRYLGKQEKPEPDYDETDPAFHGYLEKERFYEEHSFLLYDGGEDSGEDGSVNAKTAKENPQPEKAGAKDTSLTCAASSVWPITGVTYQKAQLADYDFLIKHFYSIHTSTTVGRDLMRADKFLAEDFTLKESTADPQILIYHTHSQEAFKDHGPGNPQATVVGLGSYLTKLLTTKGYNVYHDTSVYDLKNGKLDRNKAYTYALTGITRILQKNPSIQVILDIHRDGVSEKLHMVNQVNGKPTAPIMFFNGVSQTPEGPIEGLPNPYREKNLAFSFQLQLNAAAYFPNLTRKIYIKGLRYNQHLRPRSVLIEVGAQTNTYQEALNAMEPLAEVLDMVLQGN